MGLLSKEGKTEECQEYTEIRRIEKEVFISLLKFSSEVT